MFKKCFKPNDTYGVNETKFLKRVEDGRQLKVVRVSAEVAYPPQPDVGNFTLDNQLKAGVLPHPISGYELPPKESEVAQRLNDFIEDFDKLKTEENDE